MPRFIAERYALSERPVASGGIADVYSAADMSAGGPHPPVAVKLIRLGEQDEEMTRLLFNREVRSLVKLRHANIVQLLEAGQDEDTSEYYLVLEWVPRSLTEFLEETPKEQRGWDDFADAVGLPLLEALAFAHDQEVVHRDVKPSNVLVTEEGTIKLADFGISKLKSHVSPEGATLAHFMSRPFSPPERDSTSSYRRDVFSFGVLVLDCLSEADVRDYPDIPTALQENKFDVPSEITEIIERATSLDPEDRPANAQVLLAELEAFQRPRRENWRKSPKLYVRLTKNAIEKLGDSLDISDSVSEQDIWPQAQEDLAADPAAEFMRTHDSGDAVLSSEDIWIYGDRWRYHAKPSPDKHGLVFVGASENYPGHIDAARDRSWQVPFELLVKHPLNYHEAEQALNAFLEQLAAFQESRAEVLRLRERERLFQQWFAQLRALKETESAKTTPLPFNRVALDGNRATFWLEHTPEAELVGERRAIRAAEVDLRLAGEIETVVGDKVTLYLDKRPASLPRKGSLVHDDYLGSISVERQRKAVHAVRDASVAVERRDLKDLILEPSENLQPVDTDPVLVISDDFDDDKQVALRAALGAPDFFLVEGPPGTGKTTFISELVRQHLAKEPTSRILLASQTHVALDNALERLQSVLKGHRLVRVGRPGDPRIAESVAPLLFENQMGSWAESIRKKSYAFLREWTASRGLDLESVRRALFLGELVGLKSSYETSRAVLEDMRAQLQARPPGDDLPAAEREILEGQIAAERSRQAELRRDINRVVALLAQLPGLSAEQLKQASAEELRDLPFPQKGTENGSRELRHLIGLQGEWHQSLGHREEFEAALLVSAKVVAGTCVGLARVKGIDEVAFNLCILDEASKATATQSLIPLVRAKRWVMVGDPRQLPPFQEETLQDPAVIAKYELDPDELRRTLFDRLLEGVAAECRIRLTTQHRMIKAIGDLVGDCFYDGELVSANTQAQTGLEAALPRPVAWFDTSLLPGRRERRAGQASYVNQLEAKLSADFLERLNWVADKAKWAKKHSQRDLSVVTISGYRPQAEALRQTIASRREKLSSLDITSSTVDAVQGREADVVVFSVTRSNPEGSSGFLTLTNRINVALSRGRFGLVVIGDLTFCERSGTSMAKVASYIRAHPESCHIEHLEP